MSKKRNLSAVLFGMALLAGMGGMAAAEEMPETEMYLEPEWEMQNRTDSEAEDTTEDRVETEQGGDCLPGENDEEQVIDPSDGANGEEENIGGMEMKQAGSGYEAAPYVSASALFMEAVAAGAEEITLEEDLIVDTAICIPRGRSMALRAAAGKSISIKRAERFKGSLFEIEDGAMLILGWEEDGTGMLELDSGENVQDEGFLIGGSGEVRIRYGARLKGSFSENITMTGESSDAILWDYGAADEDIIDDTGDYGESFDLGDAEIIFADTEPITYNGEEKKPQIQVLMGQLTLTRLDYTVTYSDNINAGTALVAVVGRGSYTGTKSAAFSIMPANVRYQIEGQVMDSGTALSQIVIPQAGTGDDGETVSGVVLWSASEGGASLPSDMLLSGREGESMKLYWTFLPDNDNYTLVSGEIMITFREPQVKENTSTNLELEEMEAGWVESSPNTGELSSSSRAQGTTSGEGIALVISESEKEEKESDAQEETGKEAGFESSIKQEKTAYSSGKEERPQTGDGSELSRWRTVMLAALSAAVLALVFLFGRMRRAKDN